MQLAEQPVRVDPQALEGPEKRLLCEILGLDRIADQVEGHYRSL